MKVKAVIFDLDGVIVSTDEYHFAAWKRISDEEQIYFDKEINEKLRGVSRMDSLEIILENASRKYSDKEKQLLADRKNQYYIELLDTLSVADILPGVSSILTELRNEGIKLALASSSKNAPLILDKIGMKGYFDAVVDGNEITKSKPDPEVFLLAAKKLQLEPGNCVVIEDASAGIEAANSAHMKSVAIGSACNNEKATFKYRDLTFFNINDVIFYS